MLWGIITAPTIPTACSSCVGPQPLQYGTNMPFSTSPWFGATRTYCRQPEQNDTSHTLCFNIRLLRTCCSFTEPQNRSWEPWWWWGTQRTPPASSDLKKTRPDIWIRAMIRAVVIILMLLQCWRTVLVQKQEHKSVNDGYQHSSPQRNPAEEHQPWTRWTLQLKHALSESEMTTYLPTDSRLRAMAQPMTSCMSEPMIASSTISHRMIRGTCTPQQHQTCHNTAPSVTNTHTNFSMRLSAFKKQETCAGIW